MTQNIQLKISQKKDALTSLLNRHHFIENLMELTSIRCMDDKYSALIILNVNKFKKINDFKGYAAGDFLLQEIAERLKKFPTKKYTVARIDGNEFAILVRGAWITKDEANICAFDCAKSVREILYEPYHFPENLGGHIYSITCSIGLITFKNGSGHGYSIFEQVEHAMHRSKKDVGLNAIEFAHDKDLVIHKNNLSIDGLLHTAVDLNEFVLYYQPQVDVKFEIYGVEALARWISPNLGLVEPGRFIGLAEENGLILPIGLWVIESACKQLSEWSRCVHTRDIKISINVSMLQVKQPDFISTLSNFIEKYAIDKNKLVIEITESYAVDEQYIGKLFELQKIGFAISIDDFGTGFSSLSYLKQLPLAQIKIDKSFIHDYHHGKKALTLNSNNKTNKELIKKIIEIGKVLDVEVLAEGVETVDQQNFLIDNGCKFFQGYLFGKPMPIESINDLLLKNYQKTENV